MPTAPTSVVFGPQNVYNDERVRDVIVERNWFLTGGTNQFSLYVQGDDVTVRNNIVDMTGGKYQSGFAVGVAGNISPPPNRASFYNNTFYSAAASSEFTGVGVGAGATDTTISNNLMSAPFVGAGGFKPVTIDGSASAGAAAYPGNSTANIAPSGLFDGAFPASAQTTSSAVPADFSLKPLQNTARDTGIAVPVWSDFFRTDRPQSGVPGIDMGAVEGP